LAPWLQASVQALPVDLGQRLFRTRDVAQSAFQHGTSSNQIAGGLVMKRHCQLNQSLKMTPEAAVPRSLAPHVFENLVGVEKVGGVEEGEAALRAAVAHRF